MTTGYSPCEHVVITPESHHSTPQKSSSHAHSLLASQTSLCDSGLFMDPSVFCPIEMEVLKRVSELNYLFLSGKVFKSNRDS